MPSMTAPATSSLLQRVKSSYATGSTVLGDAPISQSPIPHSSVSDHLDVLDNVLKEVETTTQPLETLMSPQAVPMAVAQMPDSLNPSAAVGSAKERLDTTVSLDTASFDVGGIQVLETEKPPELPVEVEGYLQHVEDNQSQLPPEIVVASDQTQPYMPSKPLTPVVVLPITPEIEAAGLKKNTHWSVRWLVEWSRKLMKVFSGNVVYAESEAQ